MPAILVPLAQPTPTSSFHKLYKLHISTRLQSAWRPSIPRKSSALLGSINNLETTVGQRLRVGSRLSLTESSSTTTTVSSTTTATAPTASSTTVPNVRSVRATVESLQLRWNGLVGFSHDFAEITTKLGVAVGEEGNSGTRGTSTAGSTDTMDVVLDVAGHVVVDHVGDTLDV